MKKVGIFIVIGVVVLALAWFSWNFLVPSKDIQKSIKDMRADASGLHREIIHCLPDGSCKRWEGTFKIYAFPSASDQYGGGGGAFSFFYEGKKIICGPGWRIEEK